MAKAKPLSAEASKALKLFEDGVSWHDQFERDVKKYEDAFDGLLEADSDAADWTAKLHPPYINHIVETTLAGLVDDRLSFKVVPADRFYNPGEYEQVAEGAKAHERLHRCQMKQDRFHELLRPLALQAAVAGVSVTKTSWLTKKCKKGRLELVVSESGLPMMVPSEPEQVVTYDGPHTELVNVKDFFWHEAATSLDSAKWVAHRVWLSLEECKARGKQGVFQNVDQLGQDSQFASAQSTLTTDRDRDRTKDMVEVLEIWYRTPDGWRVVTLGDRKVELVADRPNPFWHGQLPFVAMSLQPRLFSVLGKSQVEKIEHLQRSLWDLGNQTIDNVHLLNNAIYAIRSDVDDPDQFPVEPGAKWMVDDPSQVQMFQPNTAVGQIALPHMQRLEQQMQNLAGSQPFTTTSEGQVNASTATQAALVTDLASRSLAAQKNQIYQAFGRIGQIRTELNQQFIRTPVVVSELGIDEQQEFSTIIPPMLQGDYLFDVEPMAESQMRAERKAEAQAMLQMVMAYVPVAAQLAATGAAKFPNIDRYVTDWLEANGVKNPEAYFTQQPAPQVGPPGQPQGPGGPEGPGGVTAPQSIDPAVSPSNQSSLSPEVFLQRALASQGGQVNGPSFG